MKVKVFYPNKNDKIEFTRDELEKLLDEVYSEGFSDGKKSYWTYTTPNITWTNSSGNGNYNTITTSSKDGNNVGKITYNTTDCPNGSCEVGWKY